MISLKVNGKMYRLDVPVDTPLLWVIRENLGLTGTKFGCEVARCGACTGPPGESRTTSRTERGSPKLRKSRSTTETAE